MRIGIFGGSFDPVHLGHLELARCCQQQAELNEVWFVPTARQPLKHSGPSATADQRLAMLELAIADFPNWKVSRAEIDRGGVSYTVETLRHLHEVMPEAELMFMMGADALHDLPSWLDPGEICRLATPLVVARAGEPEPDFDALLAICPPDRVEHIRALQVEMEAMPISSSELRQRLAQGRSIEGMLPNAVLRYIRDKHLYSAS